MSRRGETGNAADPRAVYGAGRRATRRERRFRMALATVLETPAGRLVFGERDYGLLARAGLYESTFHREPTVMAHKAGRQDFGHWLLTELIEANETCYLEMEREMRALAASDVAETVAAQTPSVEEE